MLNYFIKFIFLGLFISFHASANNPFAKSESFDIGTDVHWSIDKENHVSSKSKGSSGHYYHLYFDNKQLDLVLTEDAAGKQIKQYDQLDIKDVKIDGKRSVLFQWCLDNQESQDRYLQQGLAVKNNICVSDGSKGSFVMRLDGGTLESLKNGRELQIVLKPYRTPLVLRYELADFKQMYTELNTKIVPAAVAAPAPAKAEPVAKSMCFSKPPAKYKSIKPVEYDCADISAKKAADQKVDTLVKIQKDIEAKQRKHAEEKRQKELAAAEAARKQQEEKMRLEAAAIAASQANQEKIGSEITEKMVSMCEKYWNKGEHRCYCQKYIDHAPAEIQANSTCQ